MNCFLIDPYRTTPIPSISLSPLHRLSPVVQRQDVEEAIRLIDEAMKMAALDPTTGLLDMDLLNSGHSAHQRQEGQLLKNALADMLTKLHRETGAARTENISKRDLLTRLVEQSSVVCCVRGCAMFQL